MTRGGRGLVMAWSGDADELTDRCPGSLAGELMQPDRTVIARLAR